MVVTDVPTRKNIALGEERGIRIKVCARTSKAKQDRPLKDWIEFECKTKDREFIMDRCLIPRGVSLDFGNFCQFIEERKSC